MILPKYGVRVLGCCSAWRRFVSPILTLTQLKQKSVSLLPTLLQARIFFVHPSHDATPNKPLFSVHFYDTKNEEKKDPEAVIRVENTASGDQLSLIRYLVGYC